MTDKFVAVLRPEGVSPRAERLATWVTSTEAVSNMAESDPVRQEAEDVVIARALTQLVHSNPGWHFLADTAEIEYENGPYMGDPSHWDLTFEAYQQRRANQLRLAFVRLWAEPPQEGRPND